MSDAHLQHHSIGISNVELRQEELRWIPWIWEGVVLQKAITLLSAPEKIGKTTLLSLLLDRRRAGGQLLGRTVYPGKTVVCSEENELLWALRQPPLDLGPNVIFHSPDTMSPTRSGWRDFMQDLCSIKDFNLLVIDTAANFIPLAHKSARLRRWALGKLRFWADYDKAILVLNQSRYFHRPLAAFADIVIEMTMPRPHSAHSPLSPYGRGAAPHSPLSPYGRGAGGEGRGAGGEGSGAGGEGTRRRLFTGVGRYPGTLQTVQAELNAAGTDYLLLEGSPPPHPPLLGTLQKLLEASPTPLTRQELLARWPGDPPRPDTLWRTLTRGVETGMFTISGEGTKRDAFRYGMTITPGPAAEQDR